MQVQKNIASIYSNYIFCANLHFYFDNKERKTIILFFNLHFFFCSIHVGGSAFLPNNRVPCRRFGIPAEQSRVQYCAAGMPHLLLALNQVHHGDAGTSKTDVFVVEVCHGCNGGKILPYE